MSAINRNAGGAQDNPGEGQRGVPAENLPPVADPGRSSPKDQRSRESEFARSHERDVALLLDTLKVIEDNNVYLIRVMSRDLDADEFVLWASQNSHVPQGFREHVVPAIDGWPASRIPEQRKKNMVALASTFVETNLMRILKSTGPKAQEGPEWDGFILRELEFLTKREKVQREFCRRLGERLRGFDPQKQDILGELSEAGAETLRSMRIIPRGRIVAGWVIPEGDRTSEIRVK